MNDQSSPKRGLNDEELKALVDSELKQSVGYWGGKLAEQRRKAEYYYLALPKGDLAPPDIEGRSSVVSPVVRNTVEAMLPSLMVKFTGGDKVVEFEPTLPDDEKAAENATDYLNYLFFKKNPGHRIVYNWFKDALLLKNGILKVWWDTRNEETREEYKSLTPVELAQLMDDEEVEVTEKTEYPDEEDAEERQKAVQQLQQQLQQAQQAAQQGNPQAQQAVQQMEQRLQQIAQMPPAMLYDVACTRTKKGGKITVENIPPEEFLISRRAKDIASAPFVAHRVLRTVSELRSMGYKNVDAIEGDEGAIAQFNMEAIERRAWDDELAYTNQMSETNDESMRSVWVIEAYVRADRDGSGVADLLKVTKAGNQLLEVEVVDCAPFVSITPVPRPHQFFGLSIADLGMESQRVETSLLRSVLDNNYLEVNGRYFAVENQVNLDDLLMSRPGGVVRVKQPGAVGRLDQGKGNTGESMALIQWFNDKFTPDATGWSPNSAGTDPQALGQTATATQIVTNKADMRLDLIARNFAEGFVELFRMMLKLVCQHQDKEAVIRLSGQWVNMDPRQWRNQFDLSINVGLGMGNKDQQIAHLMALFQAQGHAMQVGAANPGNVYNLLAELTKAMGFKSPDKFVSKPDPNRPPPNPMQGEMQKAQMELQAKGQMHQAEMQHKAQIEQMKMQQEMQLEQMKAQMQAEVDNNRQRSEAEQQAAKIQWEMQLKQLEQEHTQERHAREQQQALEIEKIKAQAQILVAKISSGVPQTPDEVEGSMEIFQTGPTKTDLILQQVQANHAQTLETLSGMVGAMTKPKQIVRDANGRAVGIQ